MGTRAVMGVARKQIWSTGTRNLTATLDATRNIQESFAVLDGGELSSGSARHLIRGGWQCDCALCFVDVRQQSPRQNQVSFVESKEISSNARIRAIFRC